ncbi:CRISPR-associated helicase Cas3' [Labilibaculum euxinus]|uniref:CRISPR-associated helicase Cas3 n=1 Tax=Labilibaculum euxinus TaxID=2686357 RepID=A0A7M4D9T0_9BACT|nr:CRISPR-associated helicase Cas3' [Labilibaculum euxinus]MUP39409.1 CRISPR-associated helicase Cas3' [Labilibaculum euxinus]MVB08614.1 CRISPR-associated helicase Cas3' [Labilibaculum euxinus]
MNNENTKILAKPSGITLEEHTSNVMSEAHAIIKTKSFIFIKYLDYVGVPLVKRLEIAVRFHDEGKKHPQWQDACRKDFDNFKKWQKTNIGNFHDYERAVGKNAGANIRKVGIRHEWYSVKLLEDKFKIKPEQEEAFTIIETAIVAHHSKLSHQFEERWKREGMEYFWKKFSKQSNLISEKEVLSNLLQLNYRFSALRVILQLADRRASAIENGDKPCSFQSFKYRFPHSQKRGVQTLIEKYWQDNFLLVRAPTGAGKTDASLLWASLQIENNRADRLIIAMPTRFTSNALAINVTESLSETGLYHSSAWFNEFENDVIKGNIKKKEAVKQHQFARLLNTSTTVCTIDHLLTALTFSREDHHHIVFNLANSCLVIDEADFYDDFTQANILVLLEVLKEWKVPVLLMSASLPESVLYDYKKIGLNVSNIKEDKSDSIRPRFSIESITDYEKIEDIESLLDCCIEERTAIIYANTVDKAMLFYDYLETKGTKPIVYHSRFTEPDKQLKEQELIRCLGKEAWENKTAKGIAIMTQIGEMSINISADIMISDLCPIDRLAQRAGRLCRFDKTKIGKLHVLLPQKNDTLYPAPYGEFDKQNKCWIPIVGMTSTLKRLEQKKKYNAEELVSLLNEVYPSNQEFSAKAISNAKKLKEHIFNNWLINPMHKTKEDDNASNFWKSRNISQQDSVFIQKPESAYFKNYSDFQSWKLQYAVEVPIYLIEKYRKKNIIDLYPIEIYDEKNSIWIIREGFYNLEKGILLPDENNIW